MSQDQPHEQFQFPEEVLPRETPYAPVLLSWAAVVTKSRPVSPGGRVMPV